jgi:hypothetical protein
MYIRGVCGCEPAGRVTNAACSGVDVPRFRAAKTAERSKAILRAGSSQSPGNTPLAEDTLLVNCQCLEFAGFQDKPINSGVSGSPDDNFPHTTWGHPLFNAG